MDNIGIDVTSADSVPTIVRDNPAMRSENNHHSRKRVRISNEGQRGRGSKTESDSRRQRGDELIPSTSASATDGSRSSLDRTDKLNQERRQYRSPRVNGGRCKWIDVATCFTKYNRR